MRLVIKNADFSSVSIGKVVIDLSFTISANTNVQGGIQGFPNYVDSQVVATTIYRINDGVIETAAQQTRLLSDFIEVCEGMIISFDSANINTDTKEIPFVVCFDNSKELYTNPSIYASYKELNAVTLHKVPFVVPAGVKYIRIQSKPTSLEGKNIFVGTMPE